MRLATNPGTVAIRAGDPDRTIEERGAMTEPIPAAELAAFREVVNAATQGPWVAPMRGFDITTHADECGFRQTIVTGTYEDSVEEEVYTIDTPATREFIAQSREMCVRLLDEVERLKAAMQQVVDGLSVRGTKKLGRIAVTDRLKAALAAKGGE